jgi:hypothetical protein
MYESSILSSRGYCRKVLTKIRRGYFAEMLFPTWASFEITSLVALRGIADHQDDDITMMCLSKSQDDDIMMMCRSKSQDARWWWCAIRNHTPSKLALHHSRELVPSRVQEFVPSLVERASALWKRSSLLFSRVYAPQTKIWQVGTKDEIRIFDGRFNCHCHCHVANKKLRNFAPTT